MASSTWLSCSGMLSGLIGTYWMTLTAVALWAFAAPTRTDSKKGLVWFLVKTATVSPSANAGAANPATLSIEINNTAFFIVSLPFLFFSFGQSLIRRVRLRPRFHVEPHRQQ